MSADSYFWKRVAKLLFTQAELEAADRLWQTVCLGVEFRELAKEVMVTSTRYDDSFVVEKSTPLGHI